MILNLPEYSILFWVTAVLAVFLVGVSKAGFGGGTGLIGTPLLVLTIPVADAAALLFHLLIVADMFSISHYWKIFDRRLIRLMIPAATIGSAGFTTPPVCPSTSLSLSTYHWYTKWVLDNVVI